MDVEIERESEMSCAQFVSSVARQWKNFGNSCSSILGEALWHIWLVSPVFRSTKFIYNVALMFMELGEYVYNLNYILVVFIIFDSAV